MNIWIKVKLCEIAEYFNGRGFKPQEWSNSGLPIIRIANLNNPFAPLDYYDGILAEEHRVENGDILVSWSATLDAFIWNGSTAALNQHIFKVVPNKDVIDKDYLFFVLKKAMIGLSNQVHGATMKHVTRPVFEKFEVRIVKDIFVQHKIANQLNAQLSEVEKARKALEEQLKDTKNLANALIYKSIKEGNSQNLKLGDVLFEIKKGIGENWQDFPVLGATRNGLALAKEPPGKMPKRYKPVFPGTVFYNPMRILIGSIAFVDDDDQRGITSPDYVVLKGKEGMLDSRWFYYWLRSPLGENCIKSLARGAVRERMLFNRLVKGEIELPEFTIQQKTSDSLKELKHVILHINKELEALDSIPGKLLEKAFKTE